MHCRTGPHHVLPAAVADIAVWLQSNRLPRAEESEAMRRRAMVFILVTAGLALLTGCQATEKTDQIGESNMRIHYLEIVCRDVEAQCAALALLHGLSFGAPVADLGGARVAKTADGGLIGVRAPLAEHEQPIIRTYLEVADIAKAIKDAEAAGGVVAYPPTKQGDTGTWAIYFLGDLQFGLWQR